MNARGAADVNLNERIANLVELRPPKPEGERAEELNGLFFAGFGTGEVPFSKGGAWAVVCVYDEGDEPRWVARNFSGDLDLAMEAFRRLVPTSALALRYEPEAGWSARLDDADDEEGPSPSAAEAVCRLLWSRHLRGAGPPRGRREPGSFKGKLAPSEDFDDPLPEGVFEDWFRGGEGEQG